MTKTLLCVVTMAILVACLFLPSGMINYADAAKSKGNYPVLVVK